MEKGDIIKFGSYPWYSNGNILPIEWLVLDITENKALLISYFGIALKKYHYEFVNITWENCDLRKWLNYDFINTAFSEDEAKKIKVSELKNEDNRKYRTKGGNSTRDRVFCLSIAEAEQYFDCDEDKQCRLTSYARNQSTYVNDSNNCCYWWLRSPGHIQNDAAYINSGGVLRLVGIPVISAELAVRPALWIDITSRK